TPTPAPTPPTLARPDGGVRPLGGRGDALRLVLGEQAEDVVADGVDAALAPRAAALVGLEVVVEPGPGLAFVADALARLLLAAQRGRAAGERVALVLAEFGKALLEQLALVVVHLRTLRGGTREEPPAPVFRRRRVREPHPRCMELLEAAGASPSTAGRRPAGPHAPGGRGRLAGTAERAARRAQAGGGDRAERDRPGVGDHLRREVGDADLRR